MRYRIKQSDIAINYLSTNTIEVRGLLLNIEDIRLIVDETQKKILCSSMQKDLVQNIDHDTTRNATRITFATSLITLATTDKITFEVDLGGAIEGGDATLANQQKMMQAFNMAEEMPDMVALTDTEILNTYDGYEDEGEHIEGIADNTYGHLVPAEVTIDDEPFTFYQERTYADYGYSTLYDSEGEPYAVTNHPKEGDVLTTTI